ncbi:PRP5 [Candida pseudojiufengensis]|uniref:PRP5 n=1 Tax=Candida pseudojiufengensis TaxID=497109 RepID=UPI0022258A49|nr:PRP5 [Candida pseudojiufengensis]KAI5961579.1 PRP5 [Candida pseudojiufengensis]
MSNDTTKNDPITNKSNDKDSKDERQRKRLEQLNAWRQKKQQDETKTEEDTNDDDENQRKRRERLLAWRKKKQEQQNSGNITSSSPTNSDKSPIINTSITKIIKPKSHRKIPRARPEFEDDDQPRLKKKPNFEAPKFQNIKKLKESSQDLDELDSFIDLLENENGGVSNLIDKEEGDIFSETEDAIEEDKDIQSIIDSKLAKLGNIKTLKEIDHSKINYNKFEKNFYQVPFEISNKSDEELALSRLDLDNIRVKGSNIPAPFTNWSQLILPATMTSVINDLNFTKPSSIQSQAIPIVLSGRDLIAIAKTGSGKTLSYVIPMMRHIFDVSEGPTALILCPTRELALQIEKEVSNFSKKMNKKVVCCYGGSKIETQISELKKGVDIIVATPGRMIDLLAANGGRVVSLKSTTFVVLDEADRMFDLGFEPQINKILSQIRPDKQIVLFSATFPKKLEHLAKEILKDPIEVIVGGIGVVASEIEQKIVLFEEDNDNRNEKLYEILSTVDDKANDKVLIFVEKQSEVDKLVSNLLMKKFPCVSIHGGKDQLDRKYAIKEFSSPTSGVNILIATSIAARGLDVKNLSLVINYDPPSHLEDYVHRVGRTGRAGAKGEAITFVFKSQEKEINILVKALKSSSKEIPSELLDISENFFKRVKDGGIKTGFGFGGKGLDNLQQVRDQKIKMEKRMYEHVEDEKVNSTSKQQSPTPISMSLPTFEIIEGNSPETSGPDKCKFHSRITINDLPQSVRWGIVQRESLTKIIEESRTSITTRGKFYPSGQQQKPNDEPKLYLLVEGLTKQSVEDANTIIKEKMIQGIESLRNNDNGNTGKYSVI